MIQEAFPIRTKPLSMSDATVTSMPLRPGWWHWTVVTLGAAFVIWLHLWLSWHLIKTTNQDPVAQDQKNNMRLALQVKDLREAVPAGGLGQALRQSVPHYTDGVVAPLWPWVASFAAQPGHVIREENFTQNSVTDLYFFERGKWINVWLTAGALALIAFIAGRRLSIFGTLNILLLGSLGALLPRAVTFQPEPLYMVLFFFVWILGLRLLWANPLGLYAVWGLLCGLAYLTKTAIQPFMLMWFIAGAWRLLATKLPWPFRLTSTRWSPRQHVVGCFLAGLVFLLVIGPRLSYAQQVWGRPFFAYPNMWMWMDDFDTVGFKWMQEHPDKKALDAVPADQWPSAKNWWATHTPAQAQERLKKGVEEKFWNFVKSKTASAKALEKWARPLEHRGWYLGGALAILVVLGLATLVRGRLKLAAPAWFSQTVLVVGFCVGTLLLYGWYTPIGRGDRFMLVLYLPLVFTFISGAERCVGALERDVVGTSWWRHFYTLGQAGLLGTLLWRVSELLRYPTFLPKLM